MNRTRLSLAVAAALAVAGGALANPSGPEVVRGAATISASGQTLTVVPTAGAIIDWRGFVIAPGETTRFAQPSPSATVLNRIGSTAFGVFGRLESNARVLFIQSGQVFGDGIALDLPGINVAALRQPLSARARDIDFRAPGPAGRAVDPWVMVIMPESVPAGGGVLLPSGVSAELADARWPHVRVLITAPPGQPLDLAQLVRNSGALGIFGSLLAVPRGQSAGSADEPVQLAAGDDDIAAPVIALAEAPAAVQLATGDDDIAVPVIALAEVPERVQLAAGDDDIALLEMPAAVQLAAGDDDIAVAALALAEVPAAVQLATGDDDIALVELPAAVQLAAGDNDIAAPVIALAEAPVIATVEPLIVAAVRTVPDVAAAEDPAATAGAQPVANVEPVRRVALVTSDTPVWPKPVKLARVETRMPVIMFDRKGGIFHL